jgi:hypothetical protein
MPPLSATVDGPSLSSRPACHPNAGDGNASVYSVSCPSPGSCTAGDRARGDSERRVRMPRSTEACGLQPLEKGHQLLGNDLDSAVVGDHHVLQAHALSCGDR